jgi:exodeoxyribonuclease VII small subunit
LAQRKTRKGTRKKNDNFETKFARLEEIVQKLEHGGLELEEAIKLFREGTELVNELSELIREAELEIENLYASNDKSKK